MSKALQSISSNAAVIIPDSDMSKSVKSRLMQFTAWLDETATPWQRATLADYRDKLLADGKAPSTVRVHLSTIRSRYKAIIQDRDLLYTLVPDEFVAAADRKAVADELTLRIQSNVSSDNSKVKVIQKQDIADSEHTRLTSDEAARLIDRVGLSSRKKRRDSALLALMLATGIREGEAAAVQVGDLRQSINGELALLIREGKGSKQRLVPYGALDWCLVYVDYWLKDLEKVCKRDGIVFNDETPVFIALAKAGKTVHGSTANRLHISTRAVQKIVKAVYITRNGQKLTVKPHDLRRTYARLQYEHGLDVVSIQQNLGHSSLQTTLGYIGDLDASKRRGKAAIVPPAGLQNITL